MVEQGKDHRERGLMISGRSLETDFLVYTSIRYSTYDVAEPPPLPCGAPSKVQLYAGGPSISTSLAVTRDHDS